LVKTKAESRSSLSASSGSVAARNQRARRSADPVSAVGVLPLDVAALLEAVVVADAGQLSLPSVLVEVLDPAELDDPIVLEAVVDLQGGAAASEGDVGADHLGLCGGDGGDQAESENGGEEGLLQVVDEGHGEHLRWVRRLSPRAHR